jgi:hypothetical protein
MNIEVHVTTSGCKERERLAEAYTVSVSEWTAAVGLLNADVNVSQEEYLNTLTKIDKARAKAHAAKQAHAEHIAEHKCK